MVDKFMLSTNAAVSVHASVAHVATKIEQITVYRVHMYAFLYADNIMLQCQSEHSY